MKQLVILILLVGIAAGAWFFLSPLFIDEAVDEAFVIPTKAEVDAMPASERDEIMNGVMDVAAAQPDVMMDESMDMSVGPTAVARGQFRDGDAIHKGAGDAVLYQLPDGSHVVRLENLRVTNGPDLVLYLAEHPDPSAASEVEAGFVSLGKLKGNVGNQNYVVPSDIDVSKYNSVVVWCELFGVLFSPAPLTSA